METITLKKLRKNLFNIPASKKVSRSLFGEVDHEEVKTDLQEEYIEIIQKKSKLWNFDFEKDLPRGKENGLDWVACPSEIIESSIKPGINMITTFMKRNTSSENRQEFSNVDRSTTALSQSNCVGRIHVNDNLERRLKPDAKEVSRQGHDEDNVIRIVNASPPRPRLLKSEANECLIEPTIHAKPSSLSIGKRKRGSHQPKIDDFMKKKKPRLSLDLSMPKTLRKDVEPVAVRLCSSPNQISV